MGEGKSSGGDIKERRMKREGEREREKERERERERERIKTGKPHRKRQTDRQIDR